MREPYRRSRRGPQRTIPTRTTWATATTITTMVGSMGFSPPPPSPTHWNCPIFFFGPGLNEESGREAYRLKLS